MYIICAIYQTSIYLWHITVVVIKGVLDIDVIINGEPRSSV